MGIDSNLYFAKSFLEPIVLNTIEVYSKTWSAENRVLYNSRIEEIFEFGLERDMIISIKPSFMKDFGPKEKEFIYEILRGITIEFPESAYLLEDLRQLFKRRGYRNARYLYLETLTDNCFAYELDTKLLPKTPTRRYYYRLFSQKFGKKRLTLAQVFQEYFFTDFVELNRPKPKKVQRHKGYRDHGSLGSEFSQTLKQQSTDWTLREDAERREKLKQDLLDFLSGFGGWE